MGMLRNIFLVLGLSSVAMAQEEPKKGHTPFEVFVPNMAPGFEIEGSLLFLRPAADNLGWGVQTYFLPLITPHWSIKAIHPSYQPAFNIGIRYVFAHTGIDTQLNWTHLRTSDSDSVSVTPIQQWISPFSQTGPGTGDTTYDPTGVGELTEAKAKVDFHYDVVNLDVGTNVNIGPHMQIRLFSGLSGIRIKERLTSTFQHPAPPPSLLLENTSTYLGMGPRLGLVNVYTLYSTFRFIGEFAAGLLFGSMQPAEYKFTGSSASLEAVGVSSNRESVQSKSVSQVVPSLEGSLGLDGSYHFCRGYILTLEVGYMGAIYLNALSGYETNENILPLELGSLSTGSMKHVQSDFSVNGPYATLSLKF